VSVRTPDWRSFSTWHAVLPPNRPWQQNVDSIRALLERGSIHEAAILGATPEFRDLMTEFPTTHTTLYERDNSFLEISTANCLSAPAQSITWGDWRETLPTAVESADLILSDFTTGNIPYEDRGTFFRSLAEMLRPGGILIDRILIPTRFNTPEDLCQKYDQRVYNLQTLNDFNADAVFLNRRTLLDGIVDVDSCYEELDSSRSQRVRRLASRNRLVTPAGQTWYYGSEHPLDKHIENMSALGLELVVAEPEPPHSAYLGHAHQLTLRRS
jgi:hypothetical protein